MNATDRAQVKFRNRRTLIGAAALAPFVPALAQSGGRGSIIVGFAPGGAADGLARLTAEKLRGAVWPNVVVENKVGAAARLAIDFVRTSPADGSVMVLVPDATMFLYPHVYKGLTYDLARDFTPVTRMIGMSLAMFVGPAVPESVKTVADYVAWVKSNPKHLVYGTPAAGATPHFTGAIFAKSAGLAMTPVHYKGGAPGIQDLVGGLVPAFFGSVSDGMAMVQAGRIRVLATSGQKRAAMMPDAPTFLELGFKDLVVEDGLGIYVPSKTPADMVAKLDTAAQAALKTRDLQDPIRNWGFDISGEGPKDFMARLQRERSRWAPIVKATGFEAME